MRPRAAFAQPVDADEYANTHHLVRGADGAIDGNGMFV
jgi:hypothetical protein